MNYMLLCHYSFPFTLLSARWISLNERKSFFLRRFDERQWKKCGLITIRYYSKSSAAQTRRNGGPNGSIVPFHSNRTHGKSGQLDPSAQAPKNSPPPHRSPPSADPASQASSVPTPRRSPSRESPTLSTNFDLHDRSISMPSPSLFDFNESTFFMAVGWVYGRWLGPHHHRSHNFILFRE